MVEQGDRHRPQLRLRSGAAPGARNPLGHLRAGERGRAGARGVVRPHDRAPLAAPRPGRPGPAARRHRGSSRARRGPLPGRPGGPARPDIPRARAGTRPSRCGPAARARARRGGDPLAPRTVRRARPRPDRRGAHDDRPGELRALPAQDIQRLLDGGRPAGRGLPLRHDPAHPHDEPRPGALRLSRQRRGHRRRVPGLVRPGPRDRDLSPCPGAVGPSHEGRDPQPPRRGLSAGRRRDGLGGGDPRRGGHRARRRNPRRTRRVQRLRLADSGFRAAVGGGRPRRAAPPRDRPRRHARGADRGGSLQQRVRAARPLRLFPHLRAGEGRRGRRLVRLPQADHDRGRDGAHPEEARREGGLAARRPDRGHRRAGHADRARRRSGLLDRRLRDRSGGRSPPPGSGPRPRPPPEARRGPPSAGPRPGRGGPFRSPPGPPPPGARLRLRPAGQRRDAAPRPGGHRRMRPPRRPQPDPLHPRRGRRRARQCGPGAGPRGRARGPPGARRDPERGPGHEPDGDLVQRGPGTLRPGPRPGRPAPGRIDLPARAVPLLGHRRGDGSAPCRAPGRAARRAGRGRAHRPRPRRRAPSRARSLPPAGGRPGGVRAAGRGRRRVDPRPPAAAAVRRRQELPRHHRGPHGLGPRRPGPDGRPLAGPGRRLRGRRGRPSRLRRRGDGDGRARPSRRPRPRRIGPHGDRGGPHQPRRGRHRNPAGRGAVGELDGGRRRGRHRPPRRGPGRRPRLLPGAGGPDPGRQGQPVHADRVA